MIYGSNRLITVTMKRRTSNLVPVAATVILCTVSISAFGGRILLPLPEVDVLHIAVHQQFDAYDLLVAHGKRVGLAKF